MHFVYIFLWLKLFDNEIPEKQKINDKLFVNLTKQHGKSFNRGT